MDKEITIREALVLVDRLIKMRERLQEQIKERNCYIAKPENSKKINALIGKYTMLTQAIPKIRARIQKANIPILDQIYFIRFQKRIRCQCLAEWVMAACLIHLALITII